MHGDKWRDEVVDHKIDIQFYYQFLIGPGVVKSISKQAGNIHPCLLIPFVVVFFVFFFVSVTQACTCLKCMVKTCHKQQT